MTRTTIHPTIEYQATGRTQAVRFACAMIAAIMFAFGTFELFHLNTRTGSMITLPISFTFAMEFYAYTGNSKGVTRRRSSAFIWSATLIQLAVFGMMILAPRDFEWSDYIKFGVIFCFSLSHVLLFLAYFKQPYQQTE